MSGGPHKTDGTGRTPLAEAIEDEEARIRRLESEHASAKARLARLREERATAARAAADQAEPSERTAAVPRSPAEKVKLFRELFRGRDDLFPTRFVSRKTGKAGYAPACANKFVAGVCELPKVKCGDCPNQAFRPVDDAAILRHLRGQHVMGVYPMLRDETCWFLAVDFDKGTWKEDVRAFSGTARAAGLPYIIERSRSGNGAHVWFFFSEPVAAATVRRLGCHLLTETMASRHELGMDSYDRLFPSQDTMPRGGFGNLIALPLQHGPRQHGNSVFVDDELAAFPDDQQWSILAALRRISAAVVERIASDAARRGAIVGVRVADEGEDEAPWARPPSGPARARRVPGPMPARVSAILAQRLFIPKEGLPSPLVNQIKRLAAFQNPEFYKKQSMRLPTAMTPRVISCAEELPNHVALPRGCRTDVEELMRVHDIAFEIADERVGGAPTNVVFRGQLTADQESATSALLAHDTGVLVAPPGVGKTVIGTYLVAARGCSSLILVHRRPLLEQWLAQLAIFLGIGRDEVGTIAGGKRAATGRVDVAMIQSLVRKDSVADLVASYGQVIVDECHHLPAVQFERVLREVKARYVVGLTATPQRRDGHHPITAMQLGPTRHKIDAKTQAGARPFEHRLIVRETTFMAPAGDEKQSIHELYASLARDEARNVTILNDVVRALQEGRSPILLTERRDHLDYFADRLARVARHLVVLQGGMGAKADRATRAHLDGIAPNEERVVLATGRYVGEGFDDARLDTLFLAMPVSWKGTLVQYTGRLHRVSPGKREVQIFDYVDRNVPVLMRMFEKRLRGYRAIGYARGEAPLGYAEPKDDPMIEYDEDVYRALDHESATDRDLDLDEWVP